MSFCASFIVAVCFATIITATSADQCDLIVYKGSRFRMPARIHCGFSEHIKKINNFASECGVKVHVTSSFRKSGQVIGGAIVKPAKRSNHFVGHAIDMNLIENGVWCNSKCLENDLDRRTGAKCFINKIRNDRSLRWGGDFTAKDVVHIDDGVNRRDPTRYNNLYNRLQKNC